MSRLLARPWARDLLLGLALFCAALTLTVYPQDAMEAAQSGLTLCYHVIIPSLFPFFVLSSLVVELGLAACLGRMLEGIMRPLFRVNGACAPALALGFIGGYPVGARTAISLYEKGMCTRTEAERLLAFCNNSGPAFILGVVGAGVFSSGRAGLLLYLTHAAASLCVGMLFRFYRAGEDCGRGPGLPQPQFQAKRFTEAFTETIRSSFLSVLNICAFVVFFNVVIRLLTRTGVLTGLAGLLGTMLAPLGLDRMWAERLLTGMLELSSGVWTLSGEGALRGRLSLAAFMLGWAGLSVHCQVLSFAGGSGLSVRTYLAGKLLHGGFSAAFTAALVRLIPLERPVSSLLAQQVVELAELDFHRALAISTASAWVTFLALLLLTAVAVRKKSVHTRSSVL